jgi:molecular chaperone DnaK (HSP70)
MSTYFIGIDLGTTNTVVSYLDRRDEGAAPQLFSVLQLTDNGETQERESLASFVFIPDGNEVPEGALSLPWEGDMRFAVGELARKNAPLLPGKVIASTKSWLCAENIDRLAPVLPWNRGNTEKQMSPVEASRQILLHIRNAWNYSFASDNPEAAIEKQTVILTVPASFDAVARELTVRAASEAGLSVVLLEEPLAAFYSWLSDAGETWREKVRPDDLILVCDIGGGTTDLTLIRTVDRDGNLEFERVAVGRHILLGGDNMDLTAAYTVAAKLKESKGLTLDAYQISGLTHACREAKEKLLSSPKAATHKLTVLGRGSGLIGKSVSTEISRDELSEILLEGFFPHCGSDTVPSDARQSGLRSFGLRYESDPAITKHLATFLKSSGISGGGQGPTCVLFNGGVTKSPAVRERILEVLRGWFPENAASLRVLTGNDPDKSVARGGAWYASVREGKGIRIKAGSSHSYYVGIESSMPAVPGFTPPVQGLCIVSMGMEEGTGADIPYEGLGLLVGETSEFRFFSSRSRNEDQIGAVLSDTAGRDDVEELPVLTATLPVENEIPAGCLVPVRLRSELTETGTLQVWCIGEPSERRWKLEFEIRGDDLLAKKR